MPKAFARCVALQEDAAEGENLRSARQLFFGRPDRLGGVPIYEFVCMECESHYEELVPMGSNADCPDCGSTNVRKQFSVFAAHGVESDRGFGGGGSGGGGGGCCGGSCGCGH